MEPFDPKRTHIEMLPTKEWAIFNRDGTRFDTHTYRNRVAARKALRRIKLPRASETNAGG